MLAPIAILAACCLAIGVFPIALTGLLERAVAAWDGAAMGERVTLRSLVPLHWITMASILLAAVVAGGVLALRRWRRDKPPASAGTWDCGYARSSPRIQYTGSSFGQMVVGLLGWALWPRMTLVKLRGLFPSASRFSIETPDTVLDRALLPAFSFSERLLLLARPIQSGGVQVYLLYILAALLTLLLFTW